MEKLILYMTIIVVTIVVMGGLVSIAKSLPKHAIYIEVICPDGYTVKRDKRPDTWRYYCDSNTSSASHP